MKTIAIFLLGAGACFGFMQTKYAYPELPRWVYALDTIIAAVCLVGAFIVSGVLD